MDANLDTLPHDDVQELIWALLDDQISADEFQQLESLLSEDEAVRRLYLDCVQLHVELQQWFRARSESASPAPAGIPLDLPAFSGESPLADLST